VVVTGAQDLVVQEGDLVLAQVALPLGVLHGHPGGVHRVADVPQQGLDLASAQDRVVDVVAVSWCETLVAPVPGAVERVLEHDELELGPGKGHTAQICGSGGLGLEHGAGATGAPDRYRPATPGRTG